MHNSPPRSNRSCWITTSSSRSASGISSHSSRPTFELSSSTSPMAWTRALSLSVRLPSPRPVVPLSPVRVAILESRLPMMLPDLKRSEDTSNRQPWSKMMRYQAFSGRLLEVDRDAAQQAAEEDAVAQAEQAADRQHEGAALAQRRMHGRDDGDAVLDDEDGHHQHQRHPAAAQVQRALAAVRRDAAGVDQRPGHRRADDGAGRPGQQGAVAAAEFADDAL